MPGKETPKVQALPEWWDDWSVLPQHQYPLSEANPMCSLSKIKLQPFRPILCQKITQFWLISKSEERDQWGLGEEERGQQQHIKVRYFVLLYFQLSSVWSVPLFYSLYVTFFTFAEENKLNKLNVESLSKSINYFFKVIFWSNPCMEQTPTQF